MFDALYTLPLNLALLVFLLGCVGLDLLFGDPQGWPHPVRLIGRGLDLCEKWVRGVGIPLRLGGQIALVVMVVLCAGSVWLLTSLPLVGELAGLYLGSAGLALGCLLRECGIVLELVESGQLGQARRHLGGLVSRDTAEMNASEILRSLGETLAENFNDGFVAPFFWLALCGPIGLWAYKAVSTMDSMWGYRTERFEALGNAGAKADDLLAWIPARLSAVCIWLAGMMTLRFTSFGALVRDAEKMESPNAGWPMSAAAYVVGVSMGGPTRYFGQMKEKPLLGPTGQEWTPGKIRQMRKVLALAAALHVAVFAVLGSWLDVWSVG